MTVQQRFNHLKQYNTGDQRYIEYCDDVIKKEINDTLKHLHRMKIILNEGHAIENVLDFMLKKNPKLAILVMKILTSFSIENFKRLFLEAEKDTQIKLLLNYLNWETRTQTLKSLVGSLNPETLFNNLKKDNGLRAGIVNWYLNGFKSSFDPMICKFLSSDHIVNTISQNDSILERLILYVQGGEFAARLGTYVENYVGNFLSIEGIPHSEPRKKSKIRTATKERNFDIFIPDANDATFAMEISYLRGTACSQGDKPQSMGRNSSKSLKIGVFDGQGWLLRPRDLENVAMTCDLVYTTHPDSLSTMRDDIKKRLNNGN